MAEKKEKNKKDKKKKEPTPNEIMKNEIAEELGLTEKVYGYLSYVCLLYTSRCV